MKAEGGLSIIITKFLHRLEAVDLYTCRGHRVIKVHTNLKPAVLLGHLTNAANFLGPRVGIVTPSQGVSLIVSV